MKYVLWLVLAAWILISVFLHIVPGPGQWGDWAYPLMKFYERHHPAVQATGHIVLMAGLSYLLMRVFLQRSRIAALLLSISVSLLFAVCMEGLQGALPYGLKRTCDPYDLLPALAGILLGCLFGLKRRQKL